MQKIIVIVIFFCCSTTLFSQQPGSAAIDNLVDRSIKAFDVPGIAVGIIKDGKVIHAKGYGVRSLNTLNPKTFWRL